MEKSAIDKKIIDIIQKRSSMKTNEQGLLELSTAMASVSSINGRHCSLCSLVPSSRMINVKHTANLQHSKFSFSSILISTSLMGLNMCMRQM